MVRKDGASERRREGWLREQTIKVGRLVNALLTGELSADPFDEQRLVLNETSRFVGHAIHHQHSWVTRHAAFVQQQHHAKDGGCRHGPPLHGL